MRRGMANRTPIAVTQRDEADVKATILNDEVRVSWHTDSLDTDD